MLQADTHKLPGNSYWIPTSGFNWYHYKGNSPKEKAYISKVKDHSALSITVLIFYVRPMPCYYFMILFPHEDRIDEYTNVMCLGNLKKGEVACEDHTRRKKKYLTHF